MCNNPNYLHVTHLKELNAMLSPYSWMPVAEDTSKMTTIILFPL